MSRQRSGARRAIAFAALLVVLLLGTSVWNRLSGQSAATTVSGRDPSLDLALAESVPGEVSLDRNFYVVFDGSGSMTERSCAGRFGTRLEAAKWAVKEFTAQSVPSNVNLGLYAFDNTGARERVRLGKENRPQIATQVDAIRGGGGTPLDAAIRDGVTALATQRARQLGYGDFFLVVATDGEATDVPEARDAVKVAEQYGIPIITIGFCLQSDHALSKGSITYRNADNPEKLLAALQETQGESPYFDATVFRGR